MQIDIVWNAMKSHSQTVDVMIKMAELNSERAK